MLTTVCELLSGATSLREKLESILITLQGMYVTIMWLSCDVFTRFFSPAIKSRMKCVSPDLREALVRIASPSFQEESRLCYHFIDKIPFKKEPFFLLILICFYCWLYHSFSTFLDRALSGVLQCTQYCHTNVNCQLYVFLYMASSCLLYSYLFGHRWRRYCDDIATRHRTSVWHYNT